MVGLVSQLRWLKLFGVVKSQAIGLAALSAQPVKPFLHQRDVGSSPSGL